SGAELVMGSGRFAVPRTIEVTLNDSRTRILRDANVIVNTGTRAKVFDIPGLQQTTPLTHIETLDLDMVLSTSLFSAAATSGWNWPRCFAALAPRLLLPSRPPTLISREDADVTEAM